MDQSTDSTEKRTCHQIAFTWLWLAFVPTIIATCITFFEAFHPVAELSVHFKAVYWWVSLLCGVGMCVIKQWRWAIAAFVVFGFHSVGIVPWYMSRNMDVPEGASPNLTLMTANVLTANSTPEKVVEFIRETDADLVLLQEISPKWVELLQPLVQEQYPPMRLSNRRRIISGWQR